MSVIGEATLRRELDIEGYPIVVNMDCLVSHQKDQSCRYEQKGISEGLFTVAC